MKTIKIEITTNTKSKVELELPIYFKRLGWHYAILESGKVIRVDTCEDVESINVYNFPESHFKEDAEIITKEEFTEQFNKVTNIINEILK